MFSNRRLAAARARRQQLFDFFDFSIYIDADAEVIEEWYVTRFCRSRKTAFREPGAYFHRYAELPRPKPSIRRATSGGGLISPISREHQPTRAG